MARPGRTRKADGRREQSRDTPAGLPRSLVRVLDWLSSRLTEPVQLATLAEVAGVRSRTLETHFKAFLGTTPLGWVRRRRLGLARQRLLAADREATVTGIALASGFSELGRFAAQYRRMFGELPSETLKAGRGCPCGWADEIDDEAVRLAWRALPAALAVAPGECNAALDDAARSQELAPGYGLPKAIAAWCWGQRAAQHFSLTPSEDRTRACQLIEEALAMAPNDPTTLTLCSGALALAHRIDDADRLIEHALALDPLSPLAWSRRCWLLAYQGDSEAALRGFRRLLPYDSLRHTAFIGTGCAHFAAERYDRAVRWAKSGLELFPRAFWGERIVVAAAVHVGARAEARRAARRLLRQDPDLTVSVAARAWPFRSDFMARLADGLAIAGVPHS